MTCAAIAAAAEAAGLALRGGFHVEPGDGIDAATIVMLGWTGGAQWPVFVASPEHVDGRADPLDRWSRRAVGALADRFNARPLYPFGGPPWLPFQRWAQRSEPVFRSPIGLLIHPRWGLWHAWRGALAFPQPVALPPVPLVPHPCTPCPRPCLAGGRAACPMGAPYGEAQSAFHAAAARRPLS